MRRALFPLADAVWLIALAIFIYAGMMLATFHGDEAIHIYTSRDYVAAFIDHDPSSLMVTPPYAIDDDPWLRILNGSVDRYTIGFSLQLANLTSAMQLPRPGWDWGLDYETNVKTGHLPSDALLMASRIPSTLFLMLSVPMMFGIGWQFGGRLPAYFMSGLYTLNPIILLNGRRAMMEGSLLAFGLMAIWMAILISRGRTKWYWWVLLTLSAALALASKQTGVLYVGGALGWVGLAALTKAVENNGEEVRKRINVLLLTVGKLIVSGMLVVLIFIGLSPALWNDPVARFGDLVYQRQFLLDIQVNGHPTTMLQRLEGTVTQSFLTPPQQYEVSFWANSPAITAEVNQYMASPLSGLQFGLLGIPLTLLAAWGIVVALMQWRSWEIGLLAWLGVTVASLLVNPLDWQRYYIPLIPVATVLAGLGLIDILQRLRPATPKST